MGLKGFPKFKKNCRSVEYKTSGCQLSPNRKAITFRDGKNIGTIIAYEDLNVKGLVKNRHLAKSISDAGWSTFRQWLEYFGFKYGQVTIAVPPHNTSQNCSSCGKKVKKSRVFQNSCLSTLRVRGRQGRECSYQHPEISTQYGVPRRNLRLGRFALLGDWSNPVV